MAWRLATWPTSRSPVLVKATIDGVVRPPSSLAMTLGSPPSMTATQELVVPRSIPIILAMLFSLNLVLSPFCLFAGLAYPPENQRFYLIGRRLTADSLLISALY